MKALLSTVCAATIAFGAVIPLQAAPIFVPKAPAAETNLIEVQGGGRGENWIPSITNRRNRDDGRRSFNRRYDDDRRYSRRSVRSNNDYGWHNGHRGYKYHRPGYRRHGDFWFPAAAFIAGAIIASQPRVIVRGSSSAHVEWCYDRWRSYRAYDNTYQPYYGGRKYCHSPYRY